MPHCKPTVLNIANTVNLLNIASTVNLLDIIRTVNLLDIVRNVNLLDIARTVNLLDIAHTVNLLDIAHTVSLLDIAGNLVLLVDLAADGGDEPPGVRLAKGVKGVRLVHGEEGEPLLQHVVQVRTHVLLGLRQLVAEGESYKHRRRIKIEEKAKVVAAV